MSSRKSFMIKDILQNSNPISRDSEESNSQQDCHSCYNGDTVTYSGGLLSLTCGQSTVYQQTASLWPSFAAAAASCISCIKPLNDPSIWTTGSPDVYGTYEIGELSEQDNQQINGINSTSSGTVNSTISSSRRVRRNRTVFTELQLMGLERRFDSQKYLSTPDRAELARALGLTQLQVKTWYQNRRMKWKKQVMQGGCSTPPTKPKGRPKKNSIPSLGMNFDPAMLCSANPAGIIPITNKSSGSTTNIQSVIQTTSSLTGNFPR